MSDSSDLLSQRAGAHPEKLALIEDPPEGGRGHRIRWSYAEIEAALERHERVLDVAVFGVPSEEWGEEVKAVVQLAEGHAPGEALTAELLAHCREHLARYKCPRSVDYTDDLPRLPTGKIQRRLVRERYL